jgi:hypothetical protein
MAARSFSVTGNSGTSDTFKFPEGNKGPDNIFTMAAQGTFSSATLVMQFSVDDGTTWTAITSVSLTAAGFVNVTCRAPLYRLSWSGGAGSVAVTASVM